MTITHKASTGQVTIKLTDDETRQFMSSSAAVEAVRKAIDQAKGLPLEQRKV